VLVRHLIFLEQIGHLFRDHVVVVRGDLSAGSFS
jgi:hypothetical protein